MLAANAGGRCFPIIYYDRVVCSKKMKCLSFLFYFFSFDRSIDDDDVCCSNMLLCLDFQLSIHFSSRACRYVKVQRTTPVALMTFLRKVYVRLPGFGQSLRDHFPEVPINRFAASIFKRHRPEAALNGKFLRSNVPLFHRDLLRQKYLRVFSVR